MKRTLLVLLCFITLQLTAQTTYEIDWSFGSNPDNTNPRQNANRTIEVGDTVTWIWYASGTHTVDSTAEAQEMFSSGPDRQGQGFRYSYTFEEVGENPYICTPHPASMNGTITVVQTLSLEDKFKMNLSTFPNPVENDLTVTSLSKLAKVEVYSMLGKKLLQEQTNNLTAVRLDLSSFQSGLYFVNVTSEDGQSSVLRVMKK